MDANMIITLVGSVGFPIIACLAMGWYVKYQTDQYSQQLALIRSEHSTEMKEVTEALNNNTVAITKLCDKLDIGDK